MSGLDWIEKLGALSFNFISNLKNIELATNMVKGQTRAAVCNNTKYSDILHGPIMWAPDHISFQFW